MKHPSIIIIAILLFLSSCEKPPLLEPDPGPIKNEIVTASKTDKDWGGKPPGTTGTNQTNDGPAVLPQGKKVGRTVK